LGGVALSRFEKVALEKLVPLASKADRIVIAGRTDSIGSDSANQAVALARANAVRDYLRANLAVPDEAFVIDAQGSCCYIASNETPEGRKRNRRVEIILSVPEQVAQ
jgi:outer membrane protein OmpA-like peptidoglycan-associated protein